MTAIFAAIPLPIAIMNEAATEMTVPQMREIVVITIAGRVSNMTTAPARSAIGIFGATVEISWEGDTAPVNERNMTLPHPHRHISSNRPLEVNQKNQLNGTVRLLGMY